jgi:flagellar motor switch protein FliM
LKHQLSQQEIDSFFNAATGASPTVDAGAAPFDFRRLDRIPKSQVSAIHFLHEAFVRSLSSSLTVYLRSYVSGSPFHTTEVRHYQNEETLRMA